MARLALQQRQVIAQICKNCASVTPIRVTQVFRPSPIHLRDEEDLVRGRDVSS
jgi:hypothetical protein